ncbi:MAG: hypothetical protein ACREQY_08755 [Candidatus Binatia bacterium]
MENFAYVIRYVFHWALENPLQVVGVVLVLLALQWLLNRKTKLEKESDRVVKGLTEGAKGKYDDLRPLR